MILGFELDKLKWIGPFFLSSNDTLHNEYRKLHFGKFVLKSFATQLKPCFSLPTSNTTTDLRCLGKGLPCNSLFDANWKAPMKRNTKFFEMLGIALEIPSISN